jgi:hypothetical protein
MYLASELHAEIEKHFPPKKTIGYELTYGQISRRMNKILRPLGAKGKIIKDAELNNTSGSSRHYYCFSGYYDTEATGIPIVVNAHFASDKKSFLFTKSRYNGFMFVFSQVAQHEFIHKSQYEFHPYQSDKLVKVYHSDKLSAPRVDQIEYLSTWCEIDAYAHNIAMEINQFYSAFPPAEIVKNIDKQRKLCSYKLYKDAFRGTEWNELKKILIRKIWRWLSCGAQGPCPM